MLDKLKDWIKNVNKKFLFINLAVVAVGILAIGYIVRLVISNIGSFVSGEPFLWYPMYLLQQDEDARGKLCKPIVAIVPEKDCLELYSFPGMAGKTTNTDVFYISCNKEAENIVSDIDELVAIRCAELLCNVFGSQSAQVFQKEFAEKNNSVLQ